MATLNRKERRAQRNESNTIGILLRLFFGLSFIGLAVVLLGEFDYNFIFPHSLPQIFVVSLIYVMMNKSCITTSLAVNILMAVALSLHFSYVDYHEILLNFLHCGEPINLSTPMVTLFIGGAIVYLAVFNFYRNDAYKSRH